MIGASIVGDLLGRALNHSVSFSSGKRDPVQETQDRIVSKTNELLELHSGSANRKENPAKAWYQDDLMLDILKSEVKAPAQVASPIVINNPQYDELSEGDREAALALEDEVSKTSIKEAIAAAKTGASTAMTVNSNGNHWTGGVMVSGVGADAKPRFFYNDSMGNEMPDELRQMLGENVEIFDLQTKQQNNANDCGPFAIKNMLKLLEAGEEIDADKMKEQFSEPSEQGSAARLRLEHVKKFPSFFADPDALIKSLEKRVISEDVEAEMKDVFGKIDPDRIKENEGGGQTIGCASAEEAKQLVEKMQETCEKLGIPCQLTDKGGGSYMLEIRMPTGFKGKNPFEMGADELEKLQEAVAQDKERAAEKEKSKGKERGEGGSLVDSELVEPETEKGPAKLPPKDRNGGR